MRRLAIAAGALALMAGPAMAQQGCTRPTPPAPIDGKTATMEQMVASQAAVKAFVAGSDAYQTCVVDSLQAQRDQAKAQKVNFDEQLAMRANTQLKANQADKEAAGTAFNSAVKAYKAAHP